MIRAPVMLKAFGDGNMSLSDLVRFLEAHDEWRVEVRRLGDGALYEIGLYSEPGASIPYRKVMVAENQGFLVARIETYDAKGEVRETTRIEGAETDGLWLPKRYEIVEYGEPGRTPPGADGTNVILNGTFEVQSISIGEEANYPGGIGISMIGLDDGHKFVVADTNGVQALAVLLDDQLLPKEVYELFQGRSAQQDIALEPEENTTKRGASK